jgi:hypothetical protein
LLDVHDVSPIGIIGDDLMPCSERPSPDRDTNIIETNSEPGKEAPKSLIMAPCDSIRFTGARGRFGVQ